MGLLDLFTGAASNTAARNNRYAIATGETQANTALSDAYTGANARLQNYALPTLAAGYDVARSDLVGQTGNAAGAYGAGYDTGRSALNASYGQAGDAIQAGYGAAVDTVGGGYDQAAGQLGQGRSDLIAGYTGGQNALDKNYAAARTDLTGLYGQARNDLTNQYGQTQGYLGRATAGYQPLIDATSGASARYANATGANGAAGSAQATQDFRSNPGYGFQRDEALGAVQRSAAARGGLAGGNATADILRTSTGLADASYQQYVQNLAGVTGVNANAVAGQAGALTNQANASQAYGSQLGSLDTTLGDRLSASNMALGNASAGLSTGLGNALAANDTAQAGLSVNRGSALGNLYTGQGAALGSLYGQQGSALNASHVGEGSALGSLYGNFGSSLGNLDVGAGTGVAGIYGQQAGNLTALGNAQAGVINNSTNALVKNNNDLAQSQNAAGANILSGILGIAGLGAGGVGSAAGAAAGAGGAASGGTLGGNFLSNLFR